MINHHTFPTASGGNNHALEDRDIVLHENEYLCPENDYLCPVNEYVCPENGYVCPDNEVVPPWPSTNTSSANSPCTGGPSTSTVEPFSGGPINPTILKSFESHIAHTIWTSIEDDRGPLKCINHWSKLNLWNLDDECDAVRARVQESGLMNLARFSYRYTDRVLVSAFIERWHPETNTFHFPFGEMTITLDDVRHILNIPVEGLPVYGELGASTMAFDVALNLLCNGLGVTEVQAKMEMEKAFAVKLSWIKSICTEDNRATVDSTPERQDQVARGYLLYLLGCTVFPDKTGNKISVYYLQSLMDLDSVGNTAWGMGILAHLYRQMGLATRSGVRQVSGNLTLLQAWIFEHFSMGKPIPNKGYNEEMPRMCRWQTQHSAGDIDLALMLIREQLDDLLPNEVCWDPYNIRRGGHPFHDVAYFRGILVCFDITEPYYPDRVLRQFGRVQTIPMLPMKAQQEERGVTSTRYRVTYDIFNWTEENWQNHLLAESSRSVPVNEPWDSTHDYLAWFSKITHPYVQNPINRLIPAKKVSQPLRSEEFSADVAKTKQKITKAVQILKTSIREGLEQNLETVLTRDTQVYHILKGLLKSPLEDRMEVEVGYDGDAQHGTEDATDDEGVQEEVGSKKNTMTGLMMRIEKDVKRRRKNLSVSLL